MKTISKYVLAIFMIGAGTMHFVNPAFFLKIMPPYLPLHNELVLLSGVCELLLGILLLVPACSRWAAWGIVALLIAVFPANLHVFQHQELLQAPPLVHLFTSSPARPLHLVGLLVYETLKIRDVIWRASVLTSRCRAHR